jgi:rhamnopyranosyl-N-acetylglucosaminyl-diphospho-decaprenol beta-1,3/1,4-galactofuranosyltransferase
MACLNAIRLQTLLPDIIYVVDNHSTDGTFETMSNEQSGKTDIRYIYKNENSGGAGGFYTGMKTAYDDGYEWFWLMDDDGVPAQNALERIYFFTNKNNLHFTNALVIDKQDRISLAFGPLENGKNTMHDYSDVVYGAMNPFNGTLIHREVPLQIGFIKKEMFIYGDEIEYMLRAKRNNIVMASVAESIHYHPAEKANLIYCVPFIKKAGKVLVRSGKFAFVYYRNLGYIYSIYAENFNLILKYTAYFLIRFKFIDYYKFITAFLNGYRGKL